MGNESLNVVFLLDINIGDVSLTANRLTGHKGNHPAAYSKIVLVIASCRSCFSITCLLCL